MKLSDEYKYKSLSYDDRDDSDDSDNNNNYSQLTEYYNSELQKENKARVSLEQKHSENKNQLNNIEEELKKLNTKELHKYVNIPKLDNSEYIKALANQKLGKERCFARGEEYITPKYLLDTLAIPRLQEEAKQKNTNISKLNDSINASNREINNKRFDIQKKQTELVKYHNKLEEYIKESNNIISNLKKKLRYIDYARNYDLEIDDDNIIDECNNHRNIDICQKAYAHRYSGYSKCYKNYLQCSGKMYFVDYTYAECGCGYSSWSISDVSNNKYFDIDSTVAEGECYKFAYFNPFID